MGVKDRPAFCQRKVPVLTAFGSGVAASVITFVAMTVTLPQVEPCQSAISLGALQDAPSAVVAGDGATIGGALPQSGASSISGGAVVQAPTAAVVDVPATPGHDATGGVLRWDAALARGDTGATELDAALDPFRALMCRQRDLWFRAAEDNNSSLISAVCEQNPASSAQPQHQQRLFRLPGTIHMHKIPSAVAVTPYSANLSNVCVDEAVGVVFYDPNLAVQQARAKDRGVRAASRPFVRRRSVVTHDEWTRNQWTLTSVGTPLVASMPPRDRNVRGYILPVTYGTYHNLCHVFWRVAMLRLQMSVEFDIHLDATGAEFRGNVSDRAHVVVLITGARYGGGLDATVPPVSWGDRKGLAKQAFAKFAASMGITWSIAFDAGLTWPDPALVAAGAAVSGPTSPEVAEDVPTQPGENAPPSTAPPPPPPAATRSPAPARICFASAFAGHAIIPMYDLKTQPQMTVLKSAARAVRDWVLSDNPHGALNTAPWTELGSKARRFCLIQRFGKTRRFVDADKIIAQVRERLEAPDLPTARSVESRARCLTPRDCRDTKGAPPTPSYTSGPWTYAVLDFDSASADEQIGQIQQCSALMGIHGAALTNAAFMRTGSVLFDIVLPKQAGTAPMRGCDVPQNLAHSVYATLAAAGGVHHCGTALWPNETVPNDAPLPGDFDVAALPRRALDDMELALWRQGTHDGKPSGVQAKWLFDGSPRRYGGHSELAFGDEGPTPLPRPNGGGGGGGGSVVRTGVTSGVITKKITGVMRKRISGVPMKRG
jgi:hypothetical protein